MSSIVISFRDQVKQKEPAWYIALELLSGLVVTAAFLGYWVRGLVESSPHLAPCLFAGALLWSAWSAPREHARSAETLRAQLEKDGNQAWFSWYARFGIWFEMAFCVPAVWFGASAVLRVM